MDERTNHLKAINFFKDPRIQAAKKLIQEAVEDHQSHLSLSNQPVKELQEEYQKLLETFSQLRGGKLYYPYVGSGFGNGPLVELMDGSVKFDMISGIGPHYWGHTHPEIITIAIEAALSDTVMQGHLQQNIDAYEYCSLLKRASGLDHCFLTSSGAMANENALKIAFQKNHPAERILAFEHCFMGRSLTLSQITDKAAYREGLPMNIHVDYLPFFREDRPEESTQLALQKLKEYISRYPKQHAILCLEMIQGEGGFHVGDKKFFRAIMEQCRSHQIAVMVDEIQTFGRTTELFAYQYFQLEDLVDIVSIGKLSQVCATLFRSNYKPKPGLLSQTFTSSTIAIKTGRYIVEQLLKEQYFGKDGKIAKIHTYFTNHFLQIKKRHPHLIHGPFGVGAMIAFTPFNGEDAKVTSFLQKLFQAGVIAFSAGSRPMRVRFLPPIGALSYHDIDEVCKIVEEVLLECDKEKE